MRVWRGKWILLKRSVSKMKNSVALVVFSTLKLCFEEFVVSL